MFTDSIWFVSMVVSLVVPYLFGCVVSTSRTVPHYIPLCMYHLPKRHMVYRRLRAFFDPILVA